MTETQAERGIAAYVFDAYGTLLDVNSAVQRHATALGPGAQRVAEIWRTKHLEYAWVRSLAGRYRDFGELAEEALEFALAAAAPEAAALKPELLQAYRELDAYPEVKSVLEALRDSGARLAVLSNGTPAMLESAIRSAGLSGLFEAVISIDEIRVYKTDARAYRLAEKRLGVEGAAISFQSSNRWDIAGAAAHGLYTVWVNRTGHRDEYADLAPCRVVPSLAELL
jgi:2-haloacid dehalogenase